MAKITGDENTPITTVPETPQMSIDDMMGIIAQMQQKLNALENKDNPVTGKEKYEGPLLYKYKLWGGVPVLTYITRKKDPTQDLVYKKGSEYIENQLLELTLAQKDKNGEYKTMKVDVIDFNRGHTLSDEMQAKIERDDSDNIIGYTFATTTEYGTFTVSPKVLN